MPCGRWKGWGSSINTAFAPGLKSDHPRAVAETIRIAESLADSEEKGDVLSLLKEQIPNENVFVKGQLATSLGQFGPAGSEMVIHLLEKKFGRQIAGRPCDGRFSRPGNCGIQKHIRKAPSASLPDRGARSAQPKRRTGRIDAANFLPLMTTMPAPNP